jgi:hypothetical protein
LGGTALAQGACIGMGPDAPQALQAQPDAVRERAGETVPASGSEQGANELRLARSRRWRPPRLSKARSAGWR